MRLSKPNIILLYISIFFLFYFFNFALGVSRVNIFKNISYAYGLLLVILIIFKVAKQKTRLHINIKLTHLFLLIQLLTFIFSTINGDGVQAITNPLHQIIFFVIFLGIYNVFDFNMKSYMIFFSNLTIYITVFSAIFALFGMIHGSFYYGPFMYDANQLYAFRLDGWYDGPNYLGPAVAIGSITLIFKLTNNNLFKLTQKNKLLHILFLIPLILALFLTGSKGSYGAFILGIISLLIFQKKLIKLTPIKLLLIPILIVGLSFGVVKLISYFGYDSERIMEELIRTKSIENNQDGGDRIGYWKTAFQMLDSANAKDFFIGHGIRHFIDTVKHATHSGYIDLFIGRGVIIFVLYLFLYFWIFILALKKRKYYNLGTLIISILALLLIKNFTNTEIPSNNFTGIIFIFLIVLVSLYDKTNNNPC